MGYRYKCFTPKTLNGFVVEDNWYAKMDAIDTLADEKKLGYIPPSRVRLEQLVSPKPPPPPVKSNPKPKPAIKKPDTIPAMFRYTADQKPLPIWFMPDKKIRNYTQQQERELIGWMHRQMNLGKIRGYKLLPLPLQVNKGKLPVEQWKRAIEKYNACCAYCLNPSRRLTVEHVVPRSKCGGSHHRANVVPACNDCNRSKRSEDAKEWCLACGYDYDLFRSRLLALYPELAQGYRVPLLTEAEAGFRRAIGAKPPP